MKTVTYSRLMSISQAEFIRQLPLALVPHDFKLGEGQAELNVNGKLLRINFTPQPETRLGGLTLPRLDVSLEFEDFDPARMADLMAGFDRCFQRGGG